MLDIGVLKERLLYDPLTGEFSWKVALPQQKIDPGDRAGYVHSSGYRIICIDGEYYYEHRLAWFYMTGKWPDDEVDHRNGRPADNRWINLREATRAKNMLNRKPQKNKLGEPGISLTRTGKYCARIQKAGKSIYLGTFSDLAEARAVRSKAAQTHFGEFNREGARS